MGSRRRSRRRVGPGPACRPAGGAIELRPIRCWRACTRRGTTRSGRTVYWGWAARPSSGTRATSSWRGHTHPTISRCSRQIDRPAQLDADTIASETSWEAARLAAGITLEAVDRGGFALVRPPGHHALADRAMGFCLVNNVAVAARYAQAELGLGRIAIVDYDVHHGNGTEAIFRGDDSVLFVSLHQWPFYPGTGGPGTSDETTLQPAAGGREAATRCTARRSPSTSSPQSATSRPTSYSSRPGLSPRRRPARRDGVVGRRVPGAVAALRRTRPTRCSRPRRRLQPGDAARTRRGRPGGLFGVERGTAGSRRPFCHLTPPRWRKSLGSSIGEPHRRLIAPAT